MSKRAENILMGLAIGIVALGLAYLSIVIEACVKRP